MESITGDSIDYIDMALDVDNEPVNAHDCIMTAFSSHFDMLLQCAFLLRML